MQNLSAAICSPFATHKVDFDQQWFEGLIQIGRYTPDIIVTDLNMPDMDGFELVRALEDLPELENCQIVAVSSLDEGEIAQRGGLPESVTVYSKPIPFNILVDLIRQRYEETLLPASH